MTTINELSKTGGIELSDAFLVWKANIRDTRAATFWTVVNAVASNIPELSGSVPVSKTFTWSSGKLLSVSYADGRKKTLTWAGDQLTSVDHSRPNLPTQRTSLSYALDGTLSAVTLSEV